MTIYILNRETSNFIHCYEDGRPNTTDNWRGSRGYVLPKGCMLTRTSKNIYKILPYQFNAGSYVMIHDRDALEIT